MRLTVSHLHPLLPIAVRPTMFEPRSAHLRHCMIHLASWAVLLFQHSFSTDSLTFCESLWYSKSLYWIVSVHFVGMRDGVFVRPFRLQRRLRCSNYRCALPSTSPDTWSIRSTVHRSFAGTVCHVTVGLAPVPVKQLGGVSFQSYFHQTAGKPVALMLADDCFGVSQGRFPSSLLAILICSTQR